MPSQQELESNLGSDSLPSNDSIPPVEEPINEQANPAFESVGIEPNPEEEKLNETDKAEYLYNIPVTETPHFAAYVTNNELHLIGYVRTNLGLVSIDAMSTLDGDNKPGPVAFAGEVPEPINKALSACMQDASMKIRREKIVLAAKGLISRARDGDQVAVDILASTRDQALKGNPHAKFSFDILNELVDENFTSVGHEELTKAAYTGDLEIYSMAVAKNLPVEVMILVNGPPITAKMVGRLPVSRVAWVSVRVLRRFSACALPRPSAIASAKIRKTHGEPQPDRDLELETGHTLRPAKKSRNRIKATARSAVTSTTNITGLCACTRGSNFVKESASAPLTILLFQSGVAFRSAMPVISCFLTSKVCRPASRDARL